MALPLLLVAGGCAQAKIAWLIAPDGREAWRVALDRAEKTREPILAFVCIENQQLTAMMDAQTFGHIDVDKAARDFLCVRVDVLDAENKTFLGTYKVGRREMEVTVVDLNGGGDVEAPGRAQVYPVTLFIAPDGELEHMIYGFAIPEDFLQVLQSAKEIIDIRERMGDKEDAKAVARLGAIYIELQRYTKGLETLEKAIALDVDAASGVGETAYLDLAVAYIAIAEQYRAAVLRDPGRADAVGALFAGVRERARLLEETYGVSLPPAAVARDDWDERAIELITKHIGTFPNGEDRCKAQYLLGAALLASVEADRIAAEALAAEGDEAAAHHHERLLLGRRHAEEVWRWFEGARDDAPCADTDWEQFSLGALAELRAEIAYAALSKKVGEFIEAEQFDAAVKELRAFANHEDYRWADRACEARFTVGEILLRAGKQAEALKQWRRLTELGTEQNPNPCAQTVWRGQALQAIQEHQK